MAGLYPTNLSELDLPELTFDNSRNVNLMKESGTPPTTQFSKNIYLELFKYLLNTVLSGYTNNKINESLIATAIESITLYKNILNSSVNITQTTNDGKKKCG